MRVIRNPQGVSNLDCQFSGSTATLIWTAEAGLTSILIERNGSLVATLGGNASFYQENSPPSGQTSYSITPIAASLSGTATNCSISVPPGPVTNLVCSSPADFSAQLSWSAPANLTSIEVRRNGDFALNITRLGQRSHSQIRQRLEALQSYSLTTISAEYSRWIDFMPSRRLNPFCASVQHEWGCDVRNFSVAGSVHGWKYRSLSHRGNGTLEMGVTSNQQNPQHVFNAPAIYPVSLTVTGPGGF